MSILREKLGYLCRIGNKRLLIGMGMTEGNRRKLKRPKTHGERGWKIMQTNVHNISTIKKGELGKKT